MLPSPTLTLLTISRSSTPSPWFIAQAVGMRATPLWIPAPGARYVETVLESALASVITEYVLRLDDDEWVSPPLRGWLKSRGFKDHPHWKFRRLHRYPGPQGTTLKIANPPLWPDWQTRLSRVELAGGRGVIHAGSPHGGGVDCRHAIVHDKFLKPAAERRAIAEQYDRVMPGAGTGGFLPFNLPEEVWTEGAMLLSPFEWAEDAPEAYGQSLVRGTE